LLTKKTTPTKRSTIPGGSRNCAKLFEDNSERIKELRRCTKCLLPETFPYITFDETGCCNICKNYKKIVYSGKDRLLEKLNPYRKNNGEQEVIIPFSGGRDSSFTLHFVKKELGLNPIAFTYDWGMVTDLARRNISRITSKLGVEHILISANISRKREYIKKNVEAWLKRPRLGTIPLFMAGDKQYFYYLDKVMKQNQIQLSIYGENPFEKTGFKTGFCGINEGSGRTYYDISLTKKVRLGLYYAKNFILNPYFLNKSLVDTIGAYLSAYFLDHDKYLFFFRYIGWDEEKINKTLINEYKWELAKDTITTWRIGDGTASFYNYIYYTVAGFTENDTFRSNQVRQGSITREQALELVYMENKPRQESIKLYCDTIGIDFENTLKSINAIPKLY
jgi:hypothetical protein